MIVRRHRAAALIVGFGLMGLGIGGGWVASASTNDPNQGTAPTAQVQSPAKFKTNASGMTIGDYVIGGEKPDLIPAQTDDGRPGYIFLSDLLWEPASNPQEAVRLMAEHEDEHGSIVVPVYASDGSTKIGSFTAGTSPNHD